MLSYYTRHSIIWIIIRMDYYDLLLLLLLFHNVDKSANVLVMVDC